MTASEDEEELWRALNSPEEEASPTLADTFAATQAFEKPIEFQRLDGAGRAIGFPPPGLPRQDPEPSEPSVPQSSILAGQPGPSDCIGGEATPLATFVPSTPGVLDALAAAIMRIENKMDGIMDSNNNLPQSVKTTQDDQTEMKTSQTEVVSTGVAPDQDGRADHHDRQPDEEGPEARAWRGEEDAGAEEDGIGWRQLGEGCPSDTEPRPPGPEDSEHSCCCCRLCS